jgi:Uma2 family endonuclease
MIAAGVFGDDDRFELIEGLLVEKMTKGRRHSRGSENCWRAIQSALPPGWHAEIEKPVRLPSRRSLPEPDVSVVRGSVDDYRDHDPGPPDVALVVEVSDATLAADRALAATYLGGDVPVSWLLNVRDRQLEVHTQASPTPTVLDESETAELILDGRTAARIAVEQLLPRA